MSLRLGTNEIQEYVKIAGGGTSEPVDLSNYYTKSEVDTKVADLVNSAPETLDTLGELATALESNADLVETLNDSITNKADKEVVDAIIEHESDVIFSTEEAETDLVLKSITVNDVAYNVGGGSGGVTSYNDLTDKPVIPSLDGYAKETYVDTKVANLVNSAPEALNTLGELATALQAHNDEYDALLETIGNKADKSELFSKDYNDLTNKPNIPNITYSEEVPEDTSTMNEGDIILVPSTGGSSGGSCNHKFTVLDLESLTTSNASVSSTDKKDISIPSLTIPNYTSYKDYHTRINIIMIVDDYNSFHGALKRTNTYSFIKSPATFYEIRVVDISYGMKESLKCSTSGVINCTITGRSGSTIYSGSGIVNIIIEEF